MKDDLHGLVLKSEARMLRVLAGAIVIVGLDDPRANAIFMAALVIVSFLMDGYARKPNAAPSHTSQK